MSVSPEKQQIIALVVRQNTPGIEEPARQLIDFLAGEGYRVVCETDTAAYLAPLVAPLGIDGIEAMTVAEIGEQGSYAVVMGGDGTMLGIARQLAKYDIPLIGINSGRLGFITDIPLDRMVPALHEILQGQARIEERSLLEARVMRESQQESEQIFCGLAFNDVVVARGTGAGMVELSVSVDGEFMYNQRADGLIVSTPTGSTAYALSAGGPLLHPSLQGIVLVPIAPHALSNRPIVVPESSEIVVELVAGRDISVNFDMQTFTSLQLGDRIVISRSPHTITFLHPRGWSYYHTLREKLHWNEYPTNEGKLT